MQAGPGRPKGSRNKLTVAAKEAVETAFTAIGGVEALSDWAKANPRDFYPIWAKLLPKNVDLTSDGKPLDPSARDARLVALVEALTRRLRDKS